MKHAADRLASIRRAAASPAWLVGALLAALVPAAAPAPVATQPAEYGVVHSRRLLVGMPLGGIGCGDFELMTDGSFSHATINNNWAHPTGDLAGSFASVWASAGGKSTARVLRLTPGYGLPAISAVDFRGLCPIASVRYPDPSVPITVSLRAFSSLIPGDLRNSALPAAVFVFTLRNEARGPCQAAVAISWENILGVGGTPAEGPFADRTGDAVQLLPLEDGAAGALFDDEAAPLLPASERYRLNARGTYALLAQPPLADSVVTTAGWNALDAAPAWWQRFAAKGEVEGTVGAGAEDKVHPAGVVCVRVPLAARQSVDMAFVVAWYTRRFYDTAGDEYGHYYEKTFDDALQVARYVLANREPLVVLTREWQDAVLRSSLPLAIAHRVIDDAGLLLTRTVLTRDSGGPDEKPGPPLFAMLGGPQTGSLPFGDLAASRTWAGMLSSWYEDLNARALRSYAAAQADSGDMRSSYGSVDSGFAASAVPATHDAEALAAWAYRLLIALRRSGDQHLLDVLYPSVKHATEAFLRNPPPVASSACPGRDAVMRLAMLRLVQALAEDMPDHAFASVCSKAADAERDEIVRSYWNGRFVQCASAPQPEGPMHRDALAGQWLADELDVGDLLPAEVVRQAVDSLAKAVAPDSAVDLDQVAGSGWCSVAGMFTSGASLLALRGHVDAALRVGEALSRAIADRLLLPWQPPLRFATGAGVETEAPGAPEAFASFNLLSALTGVDMDVVHGVLRLAPLVPRGSKSLDLPVFHPRFWGRVQRRSGLGTTVVSLTVERLLKLPSETAVLTPSTDLVVRDIILPDDLPGGKTLVASIRRTPVPGKLSRDARGRSVFTLATPLRLAVGDRLDLTFR